MKTTYKSERAAKMTYTRAERAYEAARSAENAARWALHHNDDNSPRTWTDEEEARVDAMRPETMRLFQVASDVYDAAKAQGFNVRSYHFSENATRDLIAANMD